METFMDLKPNDKVTFLHHEVGQQDGRTVVFDRRKRFTGTFVRHDDGKGHAKDGLWVRMDNDQTGTNARGQELLVFPRRDGVRRVK